jgi:hypothetical protein
VLLGILFGDKLSSDKFHIGLTVGPNLANISGLDGTSVKPGLALGLLGEWRIAGGLYLQPELLPFYQVGAKDLALRDLPAGADSLLTGRNVQRRLGYFEIPVILKYAVAYDRLHLGAGPQIGFLTSAQDKGEAEGVPAGRKITIEEDIKNDLNGTDAGVVFHAEYKLGPGPFAPSVGARYYLGLTDLVTDNPGDAVYNRVFTIVFSLAMGGAEEEEGN